MSDGETVAFVFFFFMDRKKEQFTLKLGELIMFIASSEYL